MVTLATLRTALSLDTPCLPPPRDPQDRLLQEMIGFGAPRSAVIILRYGSRRFITDWFNRLEARQRQGCMPSVTAADQIWYFSVRQLLQLFSEQQARFNPAVSTVREAILRFRGPVALQEFLGEIMNAPQRFERLLIMVILSPFVEYAREEFLYQISGIHNSVAEEIQAERNPSETLDRALVDLHHLAVEYAEQTPVFLEQIRVEEELRDAIGRQIEQVRPVSRMDPYMIDALYVSNAYYLWQVGLDFALTEFEPHVARTIYESQASREHFAYIGQVLLSFGQQGMTNDPAFRLQVDMEGRRRRRQQRQQRSPVPSMGNEGVG